MNGSKNREAGAAAAAAAAAAAGGQGIHDGLDDFQAGETAALQPQRSDVAQTITDLHSKEREALAAENHALKRLVQELRDELAEKSGEIVLLRERLTKKEHYIRNELKYIKKAAIRREKERKGRSKSRAEGRKKSKSRNGDSKTRRRKEKADGADEAKRLHNSMGDLQPAQETNADPKGTTSSRIRSKSNPRPDYSPAPTPHAAHKGLKRSESAKTTKSESHKSESSLNISSLHQSSSQITDGLDEQPAKPRRKRRISKRAKSSSAITTGTSLSSLISPTKSVQVDKHTSQPLNNHDSSVSESRQDASASDLFSSISNLGDDVSPKKKSKRRSRKTESSSKSTKPTMNEAQPKETGSNDDAPSESTGFGSYLSPRQLNLEKDTTGEVFGRSDSPDCNVLLPLELSPHVTSQKRLIPGDSHEFMRQELSTENSFNSNASHSSSESFHNKAAATSMLGNMGKGSGRTIASDDDPALDPSSGDGIEIIVSDTDVEKRPLPSATPQDFHVSSSVVGGKQQPTNISPRTTRRNTLLRPSTKELPREVDFDATEEFSLDPQIDADPIDTANMGRNVKNQETRQYSGSGETTTLARPSQNSSSSLVVDQSDVYRVLDHTIIDPYGDIGLYSGTLSLQTKLPHGQGRMRYEDDARVYDGEWNHGRWHGRAKLWNSNGDTYEGDFENDERHGKGTYSWASGRVYVGDFAHDKRHGHGELVFPDGSRYVGSFVQGAREGVGRCDFAEGGAYEGDWKANMFHGDGVCTWPDGRIYRGEFRNNKAHGQGTEIYSDGKVRHAGSWENDAPVV